MKRFLLSVFFFLAAFLFVSASPVSAKVITSQDSSVTVSQDEVVDDDLFISAPSVNIEGTVNGDVFVGTQTAKIGGVINGNLHVGSQTLTISGSVKGNIYAGAQSIVFDKAQVGGSVLTGAQNVSLDDATLINGSFFAGAANVLVDSHINRSAYIGAGFLQIGENASIGRDLYYAESENRAKINEKAAIAGSIYKSEYQEPKVKQNPQISTQVVTGFKFLGSLVSFLGALIVGFIYIKLFNKNFTNSVGIASSSFWKSFGTGFITTIALIPGLLILVITVIGVPVAGAALALFTLYSILAKIIVGELLGAWLAPKLKLKLTVFTSFALGLFVIYILKMIPIIGFVTGITVSWVGLGALILNVLPKPQKT